MGRAGQYAVAVVSLDVTTAVANVLASNNVINVVIRLRPVCDHMKFCRCFRRVG